MVSPVLFVVGSGRSGTLSWAQALHGIHEGHKRLTVPLGTMFAAGLPGRIIEDALRGPVGDWAKVESGWMYTLLVPILDRLCGPKWLWPIRRPAATVASMVGKGWYKPADDELLPVQVRYATIDGDRLMWNRWVNQAAYRITAPLVGELSLPEWRGLSQVERCAWWWDWSARRLLSTLPPDRTRIVRMETPAPARDVAAWSGLTCSPLPWSNTSVPPVLSEWDLGAVAAITGATEATLYG
jgi:hypothetical protein